MNIIIKKINNQSIFYDKDIKINIEELFLNGIFNTDKVLNVQWIQDNKWVKKHYLRKGLMTFLYDKYIIEKVINTRSYREFFILNYLYKSGFNTCKPIVGWATYGHLYYTANLVTQALPSMTFKNILQSDTDVDIYLNKIGIEIKKMHSLGIYHGDLNITNIMIDKKNENIYLLDFDKSYFKIIGQKDIKLNFNRLKRSLIKNNLFNESEYQKIIDGYRSVTR